MILRALSVLISATAPAPCVDRGPVPCVEWTAETRLALGHALMIEGGNHVDAAAIPHVLARRWRIQRRGWSYLEQVRRYSRPLTLGPRTPRQHDIMTRSWPELPRDVRRTVEAFEVGKLADPCSDAAHWASRAYLAHVPESRRTCRGAANVFVRGAR